MEAAAILDLGTGTGETLAGVLPAPPSARAVGVDESEGMLAVARGRLEEYDVTLRVADLRDPLPAGPFDLVVSALAVHHLDGPGKATLFARVAGALRPGGRFVLGDVILPPDAARGDPAHRRLGQAEHGGRAGGVDGGGRSGGDGPVAGGRPGPLQRRPPAGVTARRSPGDGTGNWRAHRPAGRSRPLSWRAP